MRRWLLVAGVLVTWGTSGGCGPRPPTPAPPIRKPPPPETRPSLCEGANLKVVAGDRDGDGKADHWRYYAATQDPARPSNRLVCLERDLDGNGRPDHVTRYTERGSEVRRWDGFDLTGDGRLDVQRFWDRSGQHVIKTMRDTTRDGKTDVWEYYGSDGKLVRAELDRNNDGAVDAWEWYEKGALVSRRFDDDFDGKVDRSEGASPGTPSPEPPPTKEPTQSAALSPQSVIRKIQRTYLSGLRACHKTLLTQDPSAGNITLEVRFTVAEGGKVTRAKLAGFTSAAFGQCVKRHVLEWRFASPSEATDMSVKLALTAE